MLSKRTYLVLQWLTLTSCSQRLDLTKPQSLLFVKTGDVLTEGTWQFDIFMRRSMSNHKSPSDTVVLSSCSVGDVHRHELVQGLDCGAGVLHGGVRASQACHSRHLPTASRGLHEGLLERRPC